jgi:aryl-alcohol dehydrogenase-like predicted oxidoreductase
VALAWVLAQGQDIVPIPGTKSRERLKENAKAADIRFSKEELENLRRDIPKGAAVGPRYPDMSTVNR